MIRCLPRLRSSRPVLILPIVALLLLGLSACGGGETTVTVTEPVTEKPPKKQEGQQTNPADIPTESGPVTGYVDNVKVEGDSMILSGWAATDDFSKPATQVVAVVGGKTVAKAVPTIERQDVVEALGEPGLGNSGFELRVPLAAVECGTPAAGIEVIGSLNGESSLINYGEGIEETVTDAC